MTMITIKPSKTADTRSCDFATVSKDTLLASSQQHIDDVRQALAFFGTLLQVAATNHDVDKITDIDGFHRDFVTGFTQTAWWDAHRKRNRHHLLQADGVPADVNLIDVLDLIADCVMAGMARTGTVYPLAVGDDVLRRAFENTVAMLTQNVRVEEEPEPDTQDPKLSPKACADVLGVTDEYIVGEIKDGRLRARERTYDSGRHRYRVDPLDFADYIEKFWPQRNRRQPRHLQSPDAPL